MFYVIDAIDSFFFRTAAPFDAGANHHATSLFPPLPSVYAGAMRNAVSSGQADQRLKIGYNGLMVNDHFWFPLPLDCVVREGIGMEYLHLAKAPVSQYPLPYSLLPQEHKMSKDTKLQGGGYIEEDGLRAYLQGNELHPSMPCHALDGVIRYENQIGIQMNPETGTSLDKHWYVIRTVRPADRHDRKCSLVVEASGTFMDNTAILKVGGESKTAQVRPLHKEVGLQAVAAQDKYFKLYLATPAIFKHGWLPWWINPETMEGTFSYKRHSIRVRLCSAAVGRYVPVGGFGISHGKPREMRYAVPAGSVYFFEIIEGTFEKANKLFHQKCLSDYRESWGFKYNNWDRLRYCDRGFGYSLVGRIGEGQGGAMLCTR